MPDPVNRKIFSQTPGLGFTLAFPAVGNSIVIPVVDTSNLTDGPDGTNFAMTLANIAKRVGGPQSGIGDPEGVAVGYVIGQTYNDTVTGSRYNFQGIIGETTGWVPGA
jgi:hypothetical protein